MSNAAYTKDLEADTAIQIAQVDVTLETDTPTAEAVPVAEPAIARPAFSTANSITEFSSSFSNPALGMFAGCFICLFGIAIVGGMITYVVFVIIALNQTSYNKQKDLCSKSNVWVYLLITLLMGFVTGCFRGFRIIIN